MLQETTKKCKIGAKQMHDTALSNWNMIYRIFKITGGGREAELMVSRYWLFGKKTFHILKKISIICKISKSVVKKALCSDRNEAQRCGVCGVKRRVFLTCLILSVIPTLQLHFPKGALGWRLLCERSLLTTFRPWINWCGCNLPPHCPDRSRFAWSAAWM